MSGWYNRGLVRIVRTVDAGWAWWVEQIIATNGGGAWEEIPCGRDEVWSMMVCDWSIPPGGEYTTGWGERGPLVESAVVKARIILYGPACLSVQLPQISNYIRDGADTHCSRGKFTPRDQFWAAASLLALKSSMLRHYTSVPLSVWYLHHTQAGYAPYFYVSILLRSV
jgi:hypothetical protein